MWEILSYNEKINGKLKAYKCRCICGKIKLVSIYNCNKRSKSCGCLKAKYYEYNKRKIDSLKNKIRINENECWIWQKGKDQDGYGICGYRKKTVKAHRLSYKLFKGQIPKSLFVCHKCDNPSCINPDHLFLGTAKDNNSDASKKKRTALGKKNGMVKYPNKVLRGSKHSFAKLTENDVLKIRKLKENHSYKDIAMIFSVAIPTIKNIIHKRTWKHI